MPVMEKQKIKTEVDLKAFHTAGNLAVADVEVNGLFTIRNVKIRDGDYGLEVIMPRIREWNQGRYKDACFFKSREMREQFDQSVIQEYLQYMGLEEEDMEYEEDEEEAELEESDFEPEDSGMTDEAVESEALVESEEAVMMGSHEM